LPAQLQRLLDDALRLADRPPAQPSFEVVDMRAGQPGERRAQESVQVVPPTLEPLEAQEREQSLAERGLADPDPALDRIRNLERRQRGLELGALTVDARADEQDLLRLRAGPDQLQRLVGDQLERPARAGAFEEADRALELGRRRGPIVEQVSFQ